MPILRFIPEATTINFVKARYIAFAIDGILMLVAIAALAIYGLNLGIDFTGGILLEAKSAKTIDIGTLRSEVGGLGFKDSKIQYFGGGECDRPLNSCVLIRVQPDEGQSNDSAVETLKGKLTNDYKIRRAEIVGPKVSQELFRDGVIAMVLAVVMIAIYVWVRFEWQYGVGALFATGHDVLVTAGLFALFQMDFTLEAVAALLMLAGYSINDTVVIFDRIRENRRKFKRMGLSELINLSTNQTLTRTILTSASTALSIIPLLIFGGPTLFNFSAAIVFGIVIGTFSSVYVASMILLYLPSPAGRVEEPPTDAKAHTA